MTVSILITIKYLFFHFRKLKNKIKTFSLIIEIWKKTKIINYSKIQLLIFKINKTTINKTHKVN